MVSAPFENPNSGRPRRSANKVDLPAPFGPTNPTRSPRLTWSDTSSKSARPAKDFGSWETVSIAESAQCPLVRCPTTTRIERADKPGAGRAVQRSLHHRNILLAFSTVVDSRSEQRPVALPVSGRVSEANQWHLRITPNTASSYKYTKP